MDYEDDFLFEEDKMLMCENKSPNKTVPLLSESFEGSGLIDIFDGNTTVPLAKVELHQMNIMEDRIPDVELVAQDQSTIYLQQHIDQMGMTITSGNVVIEKDSSNLIGISIGGGAPFCPCLYIVQVFDNTPAATDGTLEAGDELVAVNGESLKGKTKVEVAKMIQACDTRVSIIYNKLHADIQQGRTLDIVLKKVKHRLVESMGSTTADALGLSRAILCNDTLVQRLAALEKTENFYKGLVAHAKSVLHAFFDLCHLYKVLGDAFANMGVKEPQPRASEAFTKFADQHRQIEKLGIDMLKAVKPILNDLGTYLNKAIPDTRMTISKYADAKFEYLSYCLKVKEMDDEEQACVAIQEPLYRVETGNYEYRLILRCRHNARTKFAKLRSDVLVKLELLDNKHIEDIAIQLQKFSAGLADYYTNVAKLLSENALFPVEVDLSQTAFQVKQTGQVAPYEDEEEEREEEGACGFDPSKILNFDVGEEATPNNITSLSAKSESTKKEESKGLSGLNDLLDLSGFSDLNEKFEHLLQLDEQKNVSKPLLSLETKKNDDFKEKQEPLLIMEEKDKNKPFFLIESEVSKNSTSKLPAEQKNTSDSLSFLDTVEEPLIKIETN